MIPIIPIMILKVKIIWLDAEPSSSHDDPEQFSELYDVTSVEVGHVESDDVLIHEDVVVPVAEASDTSVKILLAVDWDIAASEAIVTLFAINLNLTS